MYLLSANSYKHMYIHILYYNMVGYQVLISGTHRDDIQYKYISFHLLPTKCALFDAAQG